MRLIGLQLVLFLTLTLIYAAPADNVPANSPTQTSSTESSSNPGKSGSSTSTHLSTHKATTDDRHPATTSGAEHATAHPTATTDPPAASTTRDASSPSESIQHHHPDDGHHSTSTAVLIFEILGVLAAVLVVLGIVRCLLIYSRTPNQDRIVNILHRHQLQREMEELERNPRLFHRNSLIEPPPPPYLRPPDYQDDCTPLSRPGHRPNLSLAESSVLAAEQVPLRPNG